MLTRTVYARKCTAVHPESTRGEVTRIRYPVTRITYLENFLCQTNKPSVLFKRFLPSTFSAGESAILGYSKHNLMVELYINRIKSFQKNNILAFIFGYFYLLFFCPGQKKVDPYFRENESSEASGMTDPFSS